MPDPVEQAIALALTSLPADRRRQIEQLCRSHPEFAAAIRRQAAMFDHGENALAALESSRADDDPPPPLPGHIGGYRVVRLLGQGGMGAVFLAEQEGALRRQVAIKLMRDDRDGARIKAQFEAERRALALMSHPNIALAFAEGVSDDGQPYFVMEYVDGVPVTRYCDERCLTIRARLPLFLAVCSAIQHAHQKGIVHRDLKPSNVLVSDAAGAALPKVIDFGIAVAIDFKLTEQTIDDAGHAIGTPAYMSPEQAAGGVDIDTRADIWALGVMLYEILTGELPHDSSGSGPAAALRLLREIREQEPVRPSQRFAVGPDRAEIAARRSTDARALAAELRELDWVVMRALEKDRERRYASVASFAADLQRFLDHEPLSVAPPSMSYRLAKLVRRNRLASAAFIGLFVVLVAGIAISWAAQRSEAWARRRSDALLAAYQLDDLVRAAASLWPVHPQHVDRFAAWLQRARAFVATRPAIEATLAELDRRGPRRSDDAARFAVPADQELHDAVTVMLHRLDAFCAPTDGPLARTELGLRLSRELERVTLVEAADRWREAIRSIADLTECPRYRGLTIRPQLGLIPLGRSPQGLWEFSCYAGGMRAAFVTGEGPRLREGDDVVLVLVPGGRFAMGAEKPGGGATRGNVDAHAWPDEGPVHDVELAPFFVSAFELTQDQWMRLAGTANPSVFHVGCADTPITLRHPVESVSWDEATEMLAQFGLTLPTEAQWEFAARGGGTTIWPYGNDVADLDGKANFSDAAVVRLAERTGIRVQWLDRANRQLDDGYPAHAPVGTFLPNGFGLYEICGNVGEWVFDVHRPYSDPARPGDGRRGRDGSTRVVRGPGYAYTAFEGRTTYRAKHERTVRSQSVGIRPARALDAGP